MKTSLVTATLFAATLFTSTASAQESVLESLLTNLVGQALSASTVEIQNGVSQSIANVTYHFDLDDEARSEEEQPVRKPALFTSSCSCQASVRIEDL